MRKKTIAILMCLILSMSMLAGCADLRSTDGKERDNQEKILSEASRQTGMPDIHNFFEKKMLKRILEMRDNPDLICYAYTQGMNGKFIYLGKCVGYGIPYSTQYTNPEKYETNGATLPQADPNGLFSPSSASATWLDMINEQTGAHEIMYFEPNVIVRQDKLPRRLVEEFSLVGIDY